MSDPMKEDYNEMRLALFECRKLFYKLKKKYIEKKDYMKAANTRRYEKLCTDALKVKEYNNYYCIIITDRGVTSNISGDTFMSLIGMYEMALVKISQDKTKMIEKCKYNSLDNKGYINEL